MQYADEGVGFLCVAAQIQKKKKKCEPEQRIKDVSVVTDLVQEQEC